jgi:cold-inducible RNA-binding protein
MDNNRLFVGNLPWEVNNQSLKDLFSQYGEVVDAVVISDRATGRSRGFGFVTFAKAEEAEKAKEEMNNKEIEGRAIVVSAAKKREERNDSFKDNRGFGNRN